jgi:hypothetical protein
MGDLQFVEEENAIVVSWVKAKGKRKKVKGL